MFEPEGKTAGLPKKERTRLGIMRAAIELFSKRGYRGTSVSDIARKAGVAKSAVFWYFESKDGLLEKIMRELVDSGVNDLVAATIANECSDEAELLAAFLNSMAQRLEKDPMLNRAYFLLMIETAIDGDQSEAPFVQSLDGYQRFLRIIIQNGQKKGIFKSTRTPDELSDLVSMLTLGAYTLWYRDPQKQPTELYSIIKRILRDVLLVDPSRKKDFAVIDSGETAAEKA